jgi:hypothetical protein
MIDFKKRLKKQEDERQTLLNLPPAKPKDPEQAEMLVCQICGRTWKCETAEQSRAFWKKNGGPGPMCQVCWTAYSLLNQANAHDLSLKQAVKGFLDGYSKRKHRPFREVWEKIASVK